MTAEPEYLLAVEGGVATITLNRPKRLNAMTWDLAAALVAVLRDLRFQDDVRAVVLAGAGRAFCSGADAAFFSGSERPLPGLSDNAEAMPRYQRKTPAGPFAELARTIVELEKPVIAAIVGPAMGAGLAYALACDRRFGDPTARLCVAMIRLGFGPDCGITYFLPRVAGLPTALMMVETGRVVDAAEAHAAGLIDELVPEGQALAAAQAYARELAAGASVAVDLARRCVQKGLSSGLDAMHDYEAVACTMAAATEDAREGTTALREKRPPVFKGR